MKARRQCWSRRQTRCKLFVRPFCPWAWCAFCVRHFSQRSPPCFRMLAVSTILPAVCSFPTPNPFLLRVLIFWIYFVCYWFYAWFYFLKCVSALYNEILYNAHISFLFQCLLDFVFRDFLDFVFRDFLECCLDLRFLRLLPAPSCSAAFSGFFG